MNKPSIAQNLTNEFCENLDGANYQAVLYSDYTPLNIDGFELLDAKYVTLTANEVNVINSKFQQLDSSELSSFDKFYQMIVKIGGQTYSILFSLNENTSWYENGLLSTYSMNTSMSLDSIFGLVEKQKMKCL